ncbi:four helix bundle protein [Bacteroidales bacterium OttesenSCG-928-C03]|nr:four helix bundle protein [Bacteroidales bacterium OttesenSCG-928-C03]
MNEQENTVSFFRFEDLRIYAKALDYIKWVHESFNLIPDVSQNSLVNNFEKTAQAIALNIAEGSARNKSQFVYYLKTAKSAVRECVVYTELAYKLDLYGEADREYSRSQLMELTKMIGSLVTSLQRVVSASKEEMDDDDEI